MEGSEYPKLHLPPWFHEGWEDLVEAKDWFGAGFVELASGDIVKPTFMSIDRIVGDMNDSDLPYYFIADLIILKKVSIQEITRLLPVLEDSGVFNCMQRYDRIQWDEYE